MAIEHGVRICQLLANLPREDQPPRWVWVFDDEIGRHMKEVADKRGSKSGPSTSSTSSTPMVQNAASAGRGPNS